MANHELARFVRERRRALGIRTQQDFANLLGISQQAVENIEQGRASPRLSTLAALARVLRVDESVLTAYLRDSPPSPEVIRSQYERIMAQDATLLPEFADAIRAMLAINEQYYKARIGESEADPPRQIADGRADYTPQIIAAAGDPDDLNLPENQRLLRELEADDDAEGGTPEPPDAPPDTLPDEESDE